LRAQTGAARPGPLYKRIMRFPPDFLDEIRARLPVSAVVARKVRLKKQGREWRGLSPFTAEKTPSFYANDQKMRWFDFSAGKNGNIFDFVMETEGLSFPEAVERLAADAGLPLPAVSREDEARDARRATVLDAMELAVGFFEAQLAGRANMQARAYLAGRGLADATAADFRLGYAPREKFALRDHLAAKGVDRDTMIEGGLLVHGEGIEVPYDRFRERIMFPICDRSGRVIAFGGRALDPSAPAKYLNSPETPLFHKGACLYNHHRARQPAHEKSRVIAVEGYVDVIAMTAAGFPETVAPLGTALTADQCELLWRLAEAPVLCFDGDSAGRKAAHRAIDTALPLIGDSRTLRFALLPDGLDPDDLARNGGAAAIAGVLDQAKPLVDVLWVRETTGQPLDTPEQRRGLERRLDEAIRPIGDPALRRHYEDIFRTRTAEAFGRNRAVSRPGTAPRFRPQGRPSGGPATAPAVSEALARSSLFSTRAAISPREAFILLCLMTHPPLIAAHAEAIADLSFASPELARLAQVLLKTAEIDDPDAATVTEALRREGLAPLREKLARLVGSARLRIAEGAAGALDAAASLRQALALQRKATALHSDLRAAEAEHASDPTDRTFQTLKDIKAQLSSTEGTEAALDQFGDLSGF
jgi:DNA primase